MGLLGGGGGMEIMTSQIDLGAGRCLFPWLQRPIRHANVEQATEILGIFRCERHVDGIKTMTDLMRWGLGEALSRIPLSIRSTGLTWSACLDRDQILW